MDCFLFGCHLTVSTGIEYACCYCCLGDMLLQLPEMVTEARKLEVESGYQWKQTKHLLKYIKNQEREIARTERSGVGGVSDKNMWVWPVRRLFGWGR